MIVSASEKYIVSSIGWVDKGALCVLNTDSEKAEKIVLSDATYLTLHKGRNDLFSVVHHFDGLLPRVTVHATSDPAESLASLRFENSEPVFEGDKDLWKNVPGYYVEYCNFPDEKNYWLLRMRGAEKRLERQTFDWYDESYDKGYQGVTGVMAVPDSNFVLVTVQRSSKLVLYDPDNRKMVRKINLGDNQGNPELFYCRSRNEIWASDYDTIVKLEPSTFEVIGSHRLQWVKDEYRQFIGEFAFDSNEEFCVVARPFSRDVASIDLKTLRILQTCEMDAQPLLSAVLSDGRVYSRS